MVKGKNRLIVKVQDIDVLNILLVTAKEVNHNEISGLKTTSY